MDANLMPKQFTTGEYIPSAYIDVIKRKQLQKLMTEGSLVIDQCEFFPSYDLYLPI